MVRHLEDAAGITRNTEIAAKLDQLEALVRRYAGENSARIVPLLAALLSLPVDGRYPPLGLTPLQQKKRTQNALLALLKARAEEHPAVLVFEDVHWIDPTSLEFLERVRDSVPAWRMLVVVSLRPDFALPWMSQPHVAALTINRLSPLEIAAMIESLTKSEGLPRTINDKIASKTDGVPLFVEEVTNAVLEARRAKERDGTPALQAEIAIPDTLHDSLMARLDQLAPTRIVAQVAATIGREFPLELLEAVVPLAKGEVAAAIDRLLAFGLLFPSGHPANRVYAFKHALFATRPMPVCFATDGAICTVGIAEALRLRFVDIAQTSPELVAHHYTQARKHELAIAYWAKAGQAASEKSAFAEAATHLQTALDLLVDLPAGPQRNELELQLRQLLGGALVAGKGFAAAETIQCFERALALCREFAEFASDLCRAPRNRRISRRARRVRAIPRACRGLAGSAPAADQDRTARLMGHRVLGMSLFLIGELAAGRDQLLSALELYDVKSHGPLAVVFLQDFKAAGLTYLALASVLLGDLSGGLADAHNAVEHAQQLQHPHSICYALTFMAGAHAICGDAGAVSPVADRAIALAREYAFPQWMAGGGMIRGWARVQLGEIEHGLAEIRGGIDALRNDGRAHLVQFARYLLAQALSRADRPDQALALVEQLLAQAAVTSGRWYEADLHRLKGDLLRDRDDPAAAEACYERAIPSQSGRVPPLATSRHQRARLVVARPGERRGDTPTTSCRSARASATRSSVQICTGRGICWRGRHSFSRPGTAAEVLSRTERGNAAMDDLDTDLESGYYKDRKVEEERLTDEITEVIRRFIDRRFDEERRPALRDAHAKIPDASARGFVVDADLGRGAGAGGIVPGREYGAWIRFSNGNSEVNGSRYPDARGMAMKVMGVGGAKLLDDEKDTQDFVMADNPVFFVDDLGDTRTR